MKKMNYSVKTLIATLLTSSSFLAYAGEVCCPEDTVAYCVKEGKCCSTECTTDGGCCDDGTINKVNGTTYCCQEGKYKIEGKWKYVDGPAVSKACGCPDGGKRDENTGLCCKGGNQVFDWFNQYRDVVTQTEKEACGCPWGGEIGNDGITCCKNGLALGNDADYTQVNVTACGCPNGGKPSRSGANVCCLEGAAFNPQNRHCSREDDDECYSVSERGYTDVDFENCGCPGGRPVIYKGQFGCCYHQYFQAENELPFWSYGDENPAACSGRYDVTWNDYDLSWNNGNPNPFGGDTNLDGAGTPYLTEAELKGLVREALEYAKYNEQLSSVLNWDEDKFDMDNITITDNFLELITRILKYRNSVSGYYSYDDSTKEQMLREIQNYRNGYYS